MTDGWNLWTHGSISAQHTFAGGNAIVRVNAAGQPALGVSPRMVVRAGQTIIGTATVSATAFSPYEFFYSAGYGTQEVRISFDNDYYANGEDRNLLLDSLVIEECVE